MQEQHSCVELIFQSFFLKVKPNMLPLSLDLFPVLCTVEKYSNLLHSVPHTSYSNMFWLIYSI
jgi:hypothetical protein